jgi:dipeptide/tripeptide permease
MPVASRTFRDEDGLQLTDIQRDRSPGDAGSFSLRHDEHAGCHEASSNSRPTSSTSNASSSSLSWLSPVVLNILAVETAERFSYFGFRAILVLYFTKSLKYGETKAVAYFAYTTCWAYLSPLAGALLADGPWGRYTTILRFGILYVVGLVVLTLAASMTSSADDDANLAWRRDLTFVGLFLTCLGTGGIKPCVSAFGADQVARRSPCYNRTRLVPSSVPAANASAKETDSGHPRIDVETQPRLVPSHAGRDDDCNQTTHDQSGIEQTEGCNSEHLQAYFSFFYMAINVGATASIAVVPVIRKYGGFGAAFCLSLLCMVVAVALFWLRRAEYVHESAVRPSLLGDGDADPANGADPHQPVRNDSTLAESFRLCSWLLHFNLWALLPEHLTQRMPYLCPRPMPFSNTSESNAFEMIRRGKHHLVPTVDKDESREYAEIATNSVTGDSGLHQQKLRDAAQAVYVLPILAMLPVFWCLYDQQGSVWTLQATRMDTGSLQPEQLNVVNPVEIMVLVPLFDRVIYPWLRNRHGVDLRPLRRMGWGMLLAAMSFFASAVVEHAIQQRANEMNTDNLTAPSPGTISVWWQLPQITILSLAEIFLSVTGLEFAYASSPDHLKAFIMSLYLLTTALGDMLGGVLYSSVFADWSMASAMITCGALMLLNWLAFLRVGAWWESHDAASMLLSRVPTINVDPSTSQGDEDEDC